MCDEANENEPVSEIQAAAWKLEDEQREWGYRRDAFLRKYGWSATSSTPACIWMWQRTLTDGRVILADADTAVRLTVSGDYLGKL